jgi:hypothetical protein
LGHTPVERAEMIRATMVERGLTKVVVFTPRRFCLPGWDRELLDPSTEIGAPGLFIDWPNIVMYRYYYPLLERIDPDTLIVVNEGLRTQNRHDLGYNCLRNYLQRTPHVLVFQTLPIIAEPDDVMILIDWVTRSKWKRDAFAPSMLSEVRVVGRSLLPAFTVRAVETDARTKATYAATKARLLAELREDGDKDPHVLPRNLALVGGGARFRALNGHAYLARNQRLGGDVATFRDVADDRARLLLEVPHNFVDYADALAVTRQANATLLVSDLAVDRWYFDRYTAWAGRVRDVATALHG